ncbi:MAG TPA: UDP-N-acetylmuramate--L-alanine ligase [Ktedonobacteraceae bacterium]|nr:UDP-N-acetylmuramate--L-alanine ligase [Ktedonobacteraceae bacterium]
MVDTFKHLHIVGIGGPGLNGMAHMLLDQGIEVSGCDLIRNPEIHALEQRGLIVAATHDLAHLKNIDALLVSAAVKEENIEIQGARKQGIPVLTRHNLWRQWSKERDVVAICGSHGKTTTSGMLAHLITQTGSNAGYLFGSIISGLDSGRWGSGPLIMEADEYARTFLTLSPVLTLITNIDPDHIEIYPTHEEYDAAFREIATRALSNGGQIIACGDDPGVQRALSGIEFISYGIEQGNAWRATSIKHTESKLSFTLELHGTALTEVVLQLMGEQNVLNAVGAIATASQLGIEPRAASMALSSLKGIARRLEFKGQVNNIDVFDDYAHMPLEIQATLKAVRSRFPHRRIVAYLQPHSFSRLEAFLQDFAEALSFADVACVGDVYGFREQDGQVNAIDLVSLIDGVQHKECVGDVGVAPENLLRILKAGDILVTMNAGNGSIVGTHVLTLLADKEPDKAHAKSTRE